MKLQSLFNSKFLLINAAFLLVDFFFIINIKLQIDAKVDKVYYNERRIAEHSEKIYDLRGSTKYDNQRNKLLNQKKQFLAEKERIEKLSFYFSHLFNYLIVPFILSLSILLLTLKKTIKLVKNYFILNAKPISYILSLIALFVFFGDKYWLQKNEHYLIDTTPYFCLMYGIAIISIILATIAFIKSSNYIGMALGIISLFIIGLILLSFFLAFSGNLNFG